MYISIVTNNLSFLISATTNVQFVLTQIQALYTFSRAAITNYHTLGGLTIDIYFLEAVSPRLRSKGESVSSETSWLVNDNFFFLCPYMVL